MNVLSFIAKHRFELTIFLILSTIVLLIVAGVVRNYTIAICAIIPFAIGIALPFIRG
jgi:putative effector of murein hydrolase LrgA (UPF0299 family)